MKNDMKQNKAVVKKAVNMHDAQLHGGKKTNLAKLKSGGSVSKRADGIASRGKTNCKVM
jgi:hypothetical protein